MERFSRDLLLLERLAAGGMAEVYRAKHVGFGGFEKVVAVKRILPNYASNEDFKEMFRHEANLCAQFQHANIAGVFSNGEHQGYLYLVMEFVNGKNLRQLLAKADKLKIRIPVEFSCYVVAEAAKGLAYAHKFKDESTGEQLNIVHRDMSPQNIMLGYDGTVKIVDFGIAKAAARADNTKAGVLKGKFGYMSPEQAQGQKLDRRSDIFSLGIILWELLTQRRLFSTDDDMRTLNLVRECKVIKPSRKNPNVSFGLDKIALRALSKGRGERYETADELYRDLMRYMSERHPNFIDADFSEFMSDVFKDNIEKERIKREKLNLEAPAVLAQPNQGSDQGDDGNDKTAVDDSDKTEISQIVPNESKLADLDEAIPEAPLEDHTADDHHPAHELQDLTMSGLEKEPGGLPPAKSAAKKKDKAAAQLQDVPESVSKVFEEKEELSLSNVSQLQAVPASSDSTVAKAKKKAASPSSSSNKRKMILKIAAVAIVVFALVQQGMSPEQQKPDEVAQQEQNDEGAQDFNQPRDVATEDPSIAVPAPGKVADLEERPDRSPSIVDPLKDDSAEVSDRELVDQREEPSQPQLLPPQPSADSVVDLDPEPLPVPQPAPQVEPPTDSNERGVAALPPPTFDQGPSEEAMRGAIELSSLPRATEIYVNGKLLVSKEGEALKTPLKSFPLKEGQYRVRLVNKAFGASWEGTIHIKPERLIKKDVILIKSR